MDRRLNWRRLSYLQILCVRKDKTVQMITRLNGTALLAFIACEQYRKLSWGRCFFVRRNLMCTVVYSDLLDLITAILNREDGPMLLMLSSCVFLLLEVVRKQLEAVLVQYLNDFVQHCHESVGEFKTTGDVGVRPP